MKITLEPILLREEFTAEAEQEIIAYLDETIFQPLRAALDSGVRENVQPSALAAALLAGTVWYLDGRFYGSFNAAISLELRNLGAVRGPSSFVLARGLLPVGLQVQIAESKRKSDEAHTRILDTLATAAAFVGLAEVSTGIQLGKTVDKLVGDLQKQFVETVSEVTTVPDAPPELREEIQQQVTEGTDLAVKDFSVETVTEIRKKVLQNLQEGGRSDRLAAVIEAEFGVAKRKARFIAENETSLATAKFREDRYKSVGSDSYVWSTSGNSRVRPTHGESNNHRVLDGRTFSWSSPPVVDVATGRRRHPGQDYNCFPGDLPVKFFKDTLKAFRRWYDGELAAFVTDTGVSIRATPNHPVLTLRGWKPIGQLNKSDYVVEFLEQLGESGKPDCHKRVSTIAEVFESFGEAGFCETLSGEREQFHGDGTEGDVDVVDAAGSLSIYRKTSRFERIKQFWFSETHQFASGLSGLLQTVSALFGRGFAHGFIGSSGKILSGFKSQTRHPESVSFGDGSDRNTSFNQPTPDHDSLKPRAFRDSQFTFPGLVSLDDRFWIELKSLAPFRFVRVARVYREFFHGFVYNFETVKGYYATANVAVSNCRCVALPVINE